TLRLGSERDALLVPTEAVQSGQEGQFVFVVKRDMTVDVRPVVAGPRIEKDQVIKSGLQLGETVVTEGQLRLAPGMRVRVENSQRTPG
ncbi:MAG TPA: hypothetical protein VMU80_07335, partial [Bryobacteraceae bacterium]|nr:hypothetical protein [Bryobacteraceae bacterium]